MNFRIGEGWDIHALVAGRKLILGGVEVPFHLGLLGHSDADVLMHAITDALLGPDSLCRHGFALRRGWPQAIPGHCRQADGDAHLARV